MVYIVVQELESGILLFCRLTGRGTVELTIEKGDGSAFSPEAGGEPRKSATIQVGKSRPFLLSGKKIKNLCFF